MSADVFWVEHPSEAWLPVTLREVEGKPNIRLAKAVSSTLEFEISADEAKSLARVHPSALAGVSNMISLEDLNEGVILNTLRDRFMKDKIYTYISSILVSVNPYKTLNSYGPVAMECVKNRHLSNAQIRHLMLLRKKTATRKHDSEMCHSPEPTGSSREAILCASPMAAARPSLEPTSPNGIPSTPSGRAVGAIDPREPHVYVLAADVHRALINSGTSQSVIISGESGAGKTETTKFILEYLSYLSREVTQELGEVKDVAKSVEKMILEANPIIEAFGNAQTVRNDNSSRFGKWVEIHFDSSQCISGGSLAHYLLEKSRVVNQSPGERNYHVFYQIVSAGAIRAKYDLRPAAQYYFIQQGNTSVDEDLEQKRWARTRMAFEALNFSSSEVTSLVDTLVAILWLGEVPIIESQSNPDAADIEVARELITAAELLGVQATELAQAIVSSLKAFGKGEKIRVPLKVGDAASNRDALCKYLYSKIFDSIIKRINTSLKTDKYVFGVVGVLDIFGFEIFAVNRFEQLLINYANEKLQRHFNHFVFELEQEEYQREGLHLQRVEFTDNKPCVEMIERTTNGLLAMLDEELRLPKGGDENFLERCHTSLRSKYYVKPKVKVPEFAIRHYAGEVTYSVEGFLEKNRDALSESLVLLLGKSHKSFYVQLCKEDLPGEKDAKTATAHAHAHAVRSLGSQFKSQLHELTTKIESTTPHFVRCIKSNERKAPNCFQAPMVVRQLRYAGVQAVVEVRRHGFPFRLPHKEFFQRYRLFQTSLIAPDDRAELLLAQEDRPQGEQSAWGKVCAKLLETLDADKEHRKFGLGYTKVFGKHENHLELERKREEKRKAAGVVLQCAGRGRAPRKALHKMKQMVSILRERLSEARSQSLQSLLANAGNFIQTLEDALEDDRIALLPPSLPILKDVEALHRAFLVKDTAYRNLVTVVGSGAEILSVYDKALQEAREAGEDMKTLQEYAQCMEARDKLEVLLEQRRREAEERERLLRVQAVEQQQQLELEQEKERQRVEEKEKEEQLLKEEELHLFTTSQDLAEERRMERVKRRQRSKMEVAAVPEERNWEAENVKLRLKLKALEETAKEHERLVEERSKMIEETQAFYDQKEEETRVYKLKVAGMERDYQQKVRSMELEYLAKIMDLTNRLADAETMGSSNGPDLAEKVRKLENDLAQKCNQTVALQTALENSKAMYDSQVGINGSGGNGTEKKEKESLTETLRMMVKEKSQVVNLGRMLEKEKADRQIAERALERERDERELLQTRLQQQHRQQQQQFQQQQEQQLFLQRQLQQQQEEVQQAKSKQIEELELKLDESTKYGATLQTALKTLVESNKRLLDEKKKLEEDLQTARDKNLSVNMHFQE